MMCDTEIFKAMIQYSVLGLGVYYLLLSAGFTHFPWATAYDRYFDEILFWGHQLCFASIFVGSVGLLIQRFFC